ncbi:response regulator [Psychroserpens damuponensis]|uniref:response regulator n=1 Tax=Psychroserpens damuponensis TaxID=943936 RepID=UPI000AAA9B34|nr:response regulator [Psychroserpens damuponensis]
MALKFLLIDDNAIDLFINQKMIEKEAVPTNIITFTNASDAIDYLKNLEDLTSCHMRNAPDVIFLDINMPLMNGFQFIDKFNKLNIKKEIPIKIYMLSSSANPIDLQKVKQEKSCTGFINKPLTSYAINNVMEKFRTC